MDAVPFDPSKPFEVVSSPPQQQREQVPFDPSKPFEVVSGGETTPHQQMGMARGSAHEFLKGMPIFGPLGGKALDAGNAYFSGDPEKSFSENYATAGKERQASEADFEQQHPWASTGAQIAGGATAMAAGGSTVLGGKLLGLVGKSLPSRMAMGALSGGAIGAADASLRGNDPTSGGLVGAAGGAIGPVVGKAVSSLTGGGSKAPALLSADAIKDASNAAYKSPEIASVILKPDSVDRLQDQMRAGLGKINDRLAPTTHGIIDTLDKPVNGTHFTIEDIETTRQMLGKQAGNFANPQEQTAAIRAKQSIDNYLKNIPQSDLLAGDAKAANAMLLKARADWASQAASNVLTGKVDAAELSAAAANSGANYENALRQRLKGILLSPSQRANFAQFPGVVEEMEKIVRGGSSANLLRIAGNLMGGGGGLGAMVSGGGAMLAGAGPAGFAIPATGAMLKYTSNKMIANRVAALDAMIRAMAPSNQVAAAATTATPSISHLELLTRALANRALASQTQQQ